MMKYILSTVFFLAFTCTVFAQQPARLIVRGDDMGYTHSGNEALIKCSQEGIQTSIEIIVPSPWFPEAAKMLNENPAIDVGIHLAITSEWDNIKWRPLTDGKSIRDSNGYFYPKVWPDKNYPGESLTEAKATVEDIEKEFRAQIEMAKKLIPHISHISSHMGCTNLNDEVKSMTKKLAIEYNINIDLEELNIPYMRYAGPSKTAAEKEQSFIKMLEQLEPGKTYLFLDHPGLNNAELQAVHHIGYENVAEDRQGVTDLFTSKKVKAAIAAKKIALISYKQLLSKK